MSDFTFGLWTLDGVRISPIVKAFERKATIAHNGLATALTRTSIDDPVSAEIVDRKGDVILTVHQGTTVRFVGELTTGELVTRAQENKPPSLMCTFASPLWKLKERLIGMPYPTAPSGWADMATNLILEEILEKANEDDPAFTPPLERDTGIRWNPANPTLFKTTVGVDPPGPKWLMKPAAEGLTDLQESKIPFPIIDPPTFVSKDAFNEPTGDGLNLATSDDDLGQPWTEHVVSGTNGPLYHSAAVGALTRYPSIVDSVTPEGGNYGIVGPTIAHTLVGVDWYTNNAAAFPGVVARWTGSSQATSNFLMAFVYLSLNRMFLAQKTQAQGGTFIPITNVPLPVAFTPGLWYGLRMLVNELGDVTVWHYAHTDTAKPNAPVIQVLRHPLLATGGSALESGRAGLHHAASAPVVTYYKNFVACDNTDPQSFDFRMTPVEPGTPGDPRKIATLDLAYQFGSQKPKAIFEYGDGSRTAKEIKLLIDRQGMVNRAVSLDPTGGTDIRIATDADSHAIRRAREAVIPSEFGNAALRQALVDSHVAVRKGPRRIVDFTGSPNAPVFGVDYDIGDWVPVRAKRNGRVWFGGTQPVPEWARVYSVDVSIGELGTVEVVPTLVPA